MVLLFDLRNVVSGIFPAYRSAHKLVAKEVKIEASEEKIFHRLADTEHDSITAQKLRSANRNNILRLQNALARVDLRDESKLNADFVLESNNVKEWRQYENNLRRQVYDIKIIIELLKDVIDAEREEVKLDIETPLSVIDGYFNSLRRVLKNKGLDFRTHPEYQVIFKEIDSEFQNLIRVTVKYMDNESRYFNQDITLNDYLRNKSELKRQLNGKTQIILMRIRDIEEKVKKIKDDPDFTDPLLENISYFQKQFKELMQFCEDRIKISNAIMLEAVVLQKKKFEDLKWFKTNLDDLYGEFLKQQQKLIAGESEYVRKQAVKRTEEFRRYRDALRADTKKLDDFIVSIEEEDIRDLKKESSNIQSAKTRILDWSRKFAATVVILTGVSVLAPTQLTQSSNSRDSEMNSKHVMMIAAVGNKNAESMGSLLNFLPPELFAIDAELRKGVLNRLLQENNRIDSSLNKLGLGSTGNLDYLKNIYLARKCSADSVLSKYTKQISDTEYIAKVQKTIMQNNPEFNDMAYNEDLIDKYAPKMLNSLIHPVFMKGILRIESSGNIFSVSTKGARGPYQLMHDTWYDYTDLDYDTFVWVSEISLKISIRHVNTVTYFLTRNDPRWQNNYDIITKLATIAMVYDCGQGTYADNSYRRENFESGEATDYYNSMEAYLKRFKGIFS